MKLIGSLTSPYVRKVRIVLAEKKIEYDYVIDSPWLESSKVSNINPLGKIPALVLDDDTPLFDSRVIVEYIDSVTPNNKLIPAPSRERTEVKRWEALADGMCDAAAAVFLVRQRGKIMRGLEFMAEELGEKPFCMGTHLSLADIAVGTALGYLSFRFADIDWQAAHPNLGRLYAKLMQRPSLADTAPHD